MTPITESTKHRQLSLVRTGETAQIRSVGGGRHLVSRLATLGFTPGARLRVVQNFGHGPIMVILRDTRIALGRGEAGKITVDLVGESADGL